VLSRLYYVSCDRCGIPSTDGQITGAYARRDAKRAGWKRIPRVVDPGSIGSGWGANVVAPARDLCPKCARDESQP